jgi:hypothetical protein
MSPILTAGTGAPNFTLRVSRSDSDLAMLPFARNRQLHLPLLAEFLIQGHVYRAYRASEGVSKASRIACDYANLVAGIQMRLPPTPTHSRSERDSDWTGVDESKTFPGLTTISAASRSGNYPSNSDQNLRRKPWLPSQGSERL